MRADRCFITSASLAVSSNVCGTRWWSWDYARPSPPTTRTALGTPDDEVTTTVNVSRYVPVKKESLERHRTQIERDGPFSKLPQDFMHEIMSSEFFQVASRQEPGSSDVLAKLLAG